MKINIEKRHALIILTGLIFLAGVIVVIGQNGGVSHDASQIIMEDGKTIQHVINTIESASSGTSDVLDMEIGETSTTLGEVISHLLEGKTAHSYDDGWTGCSNGKFAKLACLHSDGNWCWNDGNPVSGCSNNQNYIYHNCTIEPYSSGYTACPGNRAVAKFKNRDYQGLSSIKMLCCEVDGYQVDKNDCIQRNEGAHSMSAQLDYPCGDQDCEYWDIPASWGDTYGIVKVYDDDEYGYDLDRYWTCNFVEQ